MIRFLFRALGLLCLAVAFIFFVYDGTKSIAANALIYTKVSDFWVLIHASSLQQLQPFIEQHATRWMWDPVAMTVLSLREYARLRSAPVEDRHFVPAFERRRHHMATDEPGSTDHK